MKLFDIASLKPYSLYALLYHVMKVYILLLKYFKNSMFETCQPNYFIVQLEL